MSLVGDQTIVGIIPATTGTAVMCPLCGMGGTTGYAGVPPCQQNFGGPIEAWQESRKNLRRDGCLYLRDSSVA